MQFFERSKIEEEQTAEAKKYSDSTREGDIVCFRCGEKIGTKKGINGTTHGICKECYDKEIEKMEKEKKEG